MPDITEDTQTLRSLICEALHNIERSRQMLTGIINNKPHRSHILRNMAAIETQIAASQMIFDKLNVIVDQIEGDTVVSAKLKDHPIITELTERSAQLGKHISVELVRHEESVSGLAYKVLGFYKSGSVLLIPRASGDLLAISRYDERTELDNFRDLVSLNYDWWERSKDRAPSIWGTPEDCWADWMVEFGYIKRTVRTVVEYTTAVF